MTMVATYSDGTATIAPGAGSSALCSIKTNFVNLIHQADLQVNGKTIESTQPFINVARHFQLLSEISINDLATMRDTLGFANTLDSVKSMRYIAASGATALRAGAISSGNCLSINRPFGTPDNAAAISASQNDGVANSSLQYKLSRYVDTSSNANNLGAIVTKTQLADEFKAYYETKGD